MKQNKQGRLSVGALLALGLIAGLLTACSQEEIAAQHAVPRITVMAIGQAELGGLRELPGRIEASQRAELSFRVNGKIEQMNVAEGDDVAQGQVLAQLAQQDFRTELADRKAAYQRAAADYKRARELVDDGYITRREFDQIKSLNSKTRAALHQAKANLTYTVLKAPFAGTVARRFVENFEEIQQGEEVFSLRSSDMMDVKFDVPESIIILVDRADGAAEDHVKVSASFSAQPSLQFPLTFKETASKADPRTRTFEVTYMMAQPEELTVLPGMTASVTVDLPSLRGVVYRVPQRAVIGDIAMASQVWILDRESMTVQLKPVKVGRMLGSDIEILEGLDVGDTLVTSPSNFLLPDQTVQLVEDS
jgi:RND family efflux transporter MFP subunit